VGAVIRATTIAELKVWRRLVGGVVGLVPTMGYLHEGHLSLVRRAREESAAVAATVFVNPSQFAPHEDFTRYPRDLERDAALLAEAGCDILFAPSASEMYPEGCETHVEPGAIAQPLEGERRPGHFRGVATVVVKLLGIVEPHRAYFGEKDAQQLGVNRRVVSDLNVPVEIVGCPTVREADGLAMSSRNSFLEPEQRRAAAVLHRALQKARERIEAGERDAGVLREGMARVIGEEPLARADYLSVADPATFCELDRVDGPALLSLAAFVGQARLIDNLLVAPAPAGVCPSRSPEQLRPRSSGRRS
jgi:pantoate--beta-alanine ligase